MGVFHPVSSSVSKFLLPLATMKILSASVSLLSCVLLLSTWTPATSAPMKRHVYEQEHVHAEQADQDPHFFKMVYVQIMKLLQQEEFAKKHLDAANAVIDDKQTRMKEKSMDILGVDRNTDMDKAQEMLANYRHMSPTEMHTAYDIVKTQDTTEQLVQLTIDTNIFLVQNLVKVLKLTAADLGISSEEMDVVTAAQTTYFQAEATLEVADTAVDRADTSVDLPQEEETAPAAVEEEAGAGVEEKAATEGVEVVCGEASDEPVNGVSPRMKPLQKQTSGQPQAKANKSGAPGLGGLFPVYLLCLLVLFL